MTRFCASLFLLYVTCVLISSILIGIVIGIQSESENSVYQLPPDLSSGPGRDRGNGTPHRWITNGVYMPSDYRPNSECYDARGQAKLCDSGFVNAAFERDVEATDTCGLTGPSKYCFQAGDTDTHRTIATQCDYCDASTEALAHPSSSLTDVNGEGRQTWWQSRSMFDGIQNSKHDNVVRWVNLTLHLGKAFDVTYVRLKFFSPRPMSFAIYRKRKDDEDWLPFQYYSYNCMDTYGVPDMPILTRDNETKALCTSEYSDITPLTGGDIIFTTLEGRPSKHDFENSPVLQVSPRPLSRKSITCESCGARLLIERDSLRLWSRL